MSNFSGALQYDVLTEMSTRTYLSEYAYLLMCLRVLTTTSTTYLQQRLDYKKTVQQPYQLCTVSLFRPIEIISMLFL